MADFLYRFMLTINNPIDKGFTHDNIINLVHKFKNIIYWCMSDEIGLDTGTFHTHIYINLTNTTRFTTIMKRFTGAHLDKTIGTSKECRDYIFKEGKWIDDDKADTNIRDSHYEEGECPSDEDERKGRRTDLSNLWELVKSGLTNYQIIETYPQFIDKLDKIDKARKLYNEEKYKDTWRTLEVTYVWGTTGSGKTRSIKEKYGYSNVYTITDYMHPWDGYNGQDVILFEEFRSNLRIGDMLQFLDGYPIELPCRYSNKVACYTKVFFCTNIDLRSQYRDIQIDCPETWQAFLRRIHFVKLYQGNDTVITMETQSYLKNMFMFFDNPFEPKDPEQIELDFN